MCYISLCPMESGMKIVNKKNLDFDKVEVFAPLIAIKIIATKNIN